MKKYMITYPKNIKQRLMLINNKMIIYITDSNLKYLKTNLRENIVYIYFYKNKKKNILENFYF